MRSPLSPGLCFASARWRAAVILCLYGYQGLVAGFGLTAVPNWLAGQGASAGDIGAYVALVGTPWTVQPLWGPVVDRFGDFRMGRRRAWVLFGLLGAVATLTLLLRGDGTAAWIGPVLMLHGVFATLADTATDGMIIDGVPRDALGHATALTRIGFATGTAAGAAIFAWLLPRHGLDSAVPVLLGFAGAILLVPLLVREAADDALLSLERRRAGPAGNGSFAALFRALAEVFVSRTSIAVLALCVVTEFAVAAFGLRLAVAMVQEGGWPTETVSRLQAVLALTGGTVGALAVGWWADRVGPRRALVVLLGLSALTHAAAALLVHFVPIDAEGAGVALAASGTVSALFFVALAPVVMLGSRGAAAASRFALFMAALNLGGVLGSASSGPLGVWLGLTGLGVVASLAFAGCAVLAARLDLG